MPWYGIRDYFKIIKGGVSVWEYQLCKIGKKLITDETGWWVHTGLLLSLKNYACHKSVYERYLNIITKKKKNLCLYPVRG